MEFKMQDFFNKINFKYIQPDEKKGLKYKLYKSIRKKLNKNDTLNLNLKKLNIEDLNFLNEISKIKDTAHMSTPATGLMINYICRNLSFDQVFLNIGAYRGFSTVCGMINTKCEVHSVDNFSEFDGPEEIFNRNFLLFKKNNHFFYKNDYEIFFKNWKKKIHFYIYDAHHSYEDQYKNLEIAKNFFDKECLIYIDDFNQESVKNATKDFLNRYKNEFSVLREQYTAHNLHPTFWNGFMLFKKN